MADAAVEIQFTSAGVEHTQKRIIALSGQLRALSATIEKMPKLDIGGGAGGNVGFKKEVWREFHNIFAGIEEELDRVVQAVNKLNESMAKSASGGTRANTEAIKAQTAAMKDLSNTNAMLHEVLIGEAPLNVEIQKTRKAVAIASKEAATQTEKVAKASKRAAQSVRGFGAFSKETATVLANSVAPGMGAVVNQANALVSVFRMIISTPIGAALTAIGSSLFAVYKLMKAFSQISLDKLNRGFDYLNKRISKSVEGMERMLRMMGERKDIARLDSASSAKSALEGYQDEAELRRIEAEELRKIIRDAKSRHMGNLAQAASNSLFGAYESEAFREMQRLGKLLTMDQYEARGGHLSWSALSDEEIARARESEKEIKKLEDRLEATLKAIEDAEKNATLASEKHAELVEKEAEEQRKENEEKAKALRIKEQEKQQREAERAREKEEREAEKRRKAEERAEEARQRELERAWDTQRDVGKDILQSYLKSGGSMRDSGAQALLKMINTSAKERREEQMAADVRAAAEYLKKMSEEQGMKLGYAVAA